MRQVPNIVKFPHNAQSSPFFCALACVMLPALGYTEDIPYYCGQKGGHCIHCGCKSTAMQKHHLQLYHDYLTFTGIGLGWVWPEEHSEYQTMPGWAEGWRWPDAFFDFIFGHAGLSWKRLFRDTGRDAIYCQITKSIDDGQPVLMKLGSGPDWHVVTGYDDDGVLYGFDSHKHFDHTLRQTHPAIEPEGYTDDGLFILPDWFAALQTAILITGRAAQTVTFADILTRMIQTLEHPAHRQLEHDLMLRIDGIDPENVQETGEWLLEMVGFPVEARWHAADSSLSRLSSKAAVRDTLFEMTRQYVFDDDLAATHGTCGKIWTQFGIGPGSGGYIVRPELLSKKEVQAELKRLFAIVFDNDRVVLEVLREAAALESTSDSLQGR